MKKGFYSTMLSFLLISALLVSAITYYKVTKPMKEGWATQSSGGLYDTNYIGGLGWARNFGDWSGVQNESGGNVVLNWNYAGNAPGTVSSWTPPGWSVLWKGEEVGGVGVDQVFHKTSLEGELGENLDSPSAQETINRLGGGWVWEDNISGNSIIPASGPPDDSYGKINGDLTFYAPGTYMYGADNYVPSYADSVLLSPMLGVNAPLRPIRGEGQGGGFVQGSTKVSVCSPDSGASVLDKEAYCQMLNASEASNRECCVALGGKYTMAGNEQGPYNRAIYTNPMIEKNSADYYIHLGKCYGNCPSSYQQQVSSASI